MAIVMLSLYLQYAELHYVKKILQMSILFLRLRW
jgi:hypothetical protein